MADWDTLLDYLRGDPNKITVYGVPGTWSPWTVGYQADVARLLSPWWFRWQGVAYPASFGPVNGPITALSYRESVGVGREETVRLILLRPGLIVLVGYSQGAEVVYHVAREFLPGGRLAHRREDLVAIVTFGNPCRAAGHGHNPNAHGAGIARQPALTPLLPIWHEYALPGDMYCCADEDTYLDIGYAALTQLQLHNPWQLAQAMLALIQSNQFVSALVELLDPFTPGLAAALEELTGQPADEVIAKARPVQGGVLGGLIAGGAQFLAGLLDGVVPGGLPPIVGGALTGGTGTPTGMEKMGKTFAQLINFAVTNDHGHYHDTPAFAGTNGVAHAVNSLHRLAA